MSTEIPKTARAAVINVYGQPLTLDDAYPVKQPMDLRPGECLVKMEFSGLCHSDLHVKNGEWDEPRPRLPLVGGHEGVGRVVAIGAGTTTADIVNMGSREAGLRGQWNGIKVGDRVGCKWVGNSCLRCELCRTGKDSLCPTAVVASHGYTVDGTFADYVVSWTDYVTPIPEGLESAAAAPLLCAGVTIYQAVKNSNTYIGNWITISGAGGGLGHLGVQYAVAMGLQVIAIDTGESKRALCKSLGAHAFVDFRESPDLTKEIMDLTDGIGAHAAIIAVGDSRPFNQALEYLRPAGTLVCVGMPGGDAILHMPIRLVVPRALRIQGSQTGSRQSAIEALAIAAQGKVKVHHEIRPLSEINELMEEMENGRLTGRIVLKM